MSELAKNVGGARSGRTLERLLWTLVGLALACHLVALVHRGIMSPDSYTYVRMAESARAGSGFAVEGMAGRFPPGYPAILATLMGLGAGTAFAYQAVNLSALLGGLAFVLDCLVRRGLSRTGQLVVALMALLSLPFLRTVHYVLSDCVFFFGAAATIALLERADDAEPGWRPRLLIAAAIALVLATLVRLAGLALLPAVLFTAFGRHANAWFRRGRLLALCVAIALGLLLAIWVDVGVARSGYFAQARKAVEGQLARSGLVGGLAERAGWRLKAMGLHVLNLEPGKSPLGWPAFFVAGAVGLALSIAAMAASRTFAKPAEVFVLSYFGMLFLYPAFGPPSFGHRFWLPVLSLAMGLVTLWASSRLDRPRKAIAAIFVAVFCTLGARVLIKQTVPAAAGAPQRIERVLHFVTDRFRR